MTAEEAKIINNLPLNQTFCLQIESRGTITDELIRANKEVETTYEEEVGLIFEKNGKLWFTAFSDNEGAWVAEHDSENLFELREKYGKEKFMQYSKIPNEEIVEDNL